MPYNGAMRTIGRITFALGILLITCSPCDAWTGRCVGVSDGDTITVMHEGRGEKLRLYGIDCPEKAQAYGAAAKRFTSSMVYGRDVRVEPVTQDRYGRTVAWVYVGGLCLNHELVRAGLAWWYKKYAPRDDGLRCMETDASQRRIGLWADPNPIPPWEYRKSSRKR